MDAGASIVHALSVLIASEGAMAQDLERELAAANASCLRLDAAEAAVERAMSEDFDIVMLDMQLAGVGAAAAADILRRVGSPCLIVALGHGVSSAPGGPPSSDFDACLTLPLDGGALLAVMEQARARRADGKGVDSFIRDECADLAAQFRAELPAMLDGVRGAAQCRDLATLVSLVHRLKGTAGSYGFARVTERCAAIEKQLRQGMEDEGVRACLELAETTQRGL